MNRKTSAVLAVVGVAILLSASVVIVNMLNTPASIDERGAMDYDSGEDVSTDPKISAEEVTETFLANEERADALIEGCSLEVQKDAQGQERLVWRLTYRPLISGPQGETLYGMGMSAFFDAATGEDVTADFR